MNSTQKKLHKHNLILASASPRRQMLMNGLDLSFQIKVKTIKEIYPKDMPFEEVPIYLSKQKAAAFSKDKMANEDIIITADTIVVLDNEIIGKPKNQAEAIQIIQKLSGNAHKVITGVCLTSLHKQLAFAVESIVYFKQLNAKDIEYYVEKYSPLDKAGAYGIQDWIGYIGIEKIEGSFYNVMGLPTQRLYEELIKFIE
jgi:septum formation protein